jgi:hypothetical protein
MRTRGKIKPSKASSAFGLILGTVFLGLGLFVLIPIFGLFGVVWTGIALVITAFSAVNVFSDQGIATEVYEFESKPSRTPKASESSTTPPPPKAFPHKTVEERLQSLDELKRKGLITPDEHQAQRQRILNEL